VNAQTVRAAQTGRKNSGITEYDPESTYIPKTLGFAQSH